GQATGAANALLSAATVDAFCGLTSLTHRRRLLSTAPSLQSGTQQSVALLSSHRLHSPPGLPHAAASLPAEQITSALLTTVRHPGQQPGRFAGLTPAVAQRPTYSRPAGSRARHSSPGAELIFSYWHTA